MRYGQKRLPALAERAHERPQAVLATGCEERRNSGDEDGKRGGGEGRLRNSPGFGETVAYQAPLSTPAVGGYFLIAFKEGSESGGDGPHQGLEDPVCVWLSVCVCEAEDVTPQKAG